MSFPNMVEAFWNWTEPIQFTLVTSAAVDYEAVETPVSQTPFDGVIEPLTPRQLMIKPEGLRQFKYWTLWTEQELQPNNIVQDQYGNTYRVQSKSDWRDADGNYQQYEITQTATPPYAGS